MKRRRRSAISNALAGVPRIIQIEKNLSNYLAKLMVRNSPLGRFGFFVEILSGMRTFECTKTPTFSMAVENGHYVMRYSPVMVQELDELGAGIVIAHELGHAALCHTTRIMQVRENYKHDVDKLVKISAVMHVAADYALNSWLIDRFKMFSLRELKCRVGRPIENPTSEQLFEGEAMGTYAGIHPSDAGLPSLRSMEWYTKELLKRAGGDNSMLAPPQQGDSNSSQGSGGGGEASGEGSSSRSISKALDRMTEEQLEELMAGAGISKEQVLQEAETAIGDSDKTIDEISEALNRRFKRVMVDAAQNLPSKSRGTVAGNIIAWVEEVTKDPEINWRRLLKRYTTSAEPFRRDRSMGRPKRNFTRMRGLRTSPFPGCVANPTYEIVFAIDTSASVSNTEIQEIFAELKALLATNEGVKVTVVECDTAIVKVYELTKSIDRDVKGRGGTCFNPVFRWISERKPWLDVKEGEGGKKVVKVYPPREVDLLIYATDGECSLPSEKYRIKENKVLWLISSRGKIPGKYPYKSPDKSKSGSAKYGNYIHIKDNA